MFQQQVDEMKLRHQAEIDACHDALNQTELELTGGNLFQYLI